jgi:hypothetical protein
MAFRVATGEFPPRSAQKRAQLYRRAGCPPNLRERIEALMQL